jgi:hypothetical protein
MANSTGPKAVEPTEKAATRPRTDPRWAVPNTLGTVAASSARTLPPAAPMVSPNPTADSPGSTTLPHARPAASSSMQTASAREGDTRSARAPIARVASSAAAVCGRKFAAASVVDSPRSPSRLIWWKATAVASIPLNDTAAVTSAPPPAWPRRR